MRFVIGEALKRGLCFLSLLIFGISLSPNLNSQVNKFPTTPNRVIKTSPAQASSVKTPETNPLTKSAYPAESAPSSSNAPTVSPETQLSLPIELGAPIQTAEGTTLTLANAEVKYT